MEYYWIAGFLILMAGIVFRRWKRRRRDEDEEEEMVKKKKGKIPKGNLGFPVIGETLAFIASGYSSRPVSFMDKRKSLYGKVFKTNIIGTPIIISTDAEVNKVVLQNHGNTFVPAYPKSITKLLGDNSILSINGSHQRRLHALIGSFLRSPHLKERITRDIEVSVDLVLTSWTHLPLVLVQDEIKKMTFEILVKVLMSKSRGNDLDILKFEFEEFIKGLICIPINFPGTRLYKSLKAKERLINIVKKVVEERMKSPAPTPANDAVDVLLRDVEDGGGSVKQSEPLDYVSGKIIEMMIPGEETMPTAMTLAVKFLSDNPVALAKLGEENMEMKRRKLESGEVYTWTDYMSLSFTQNVINETLRMANIINGVWRKALKDIDIKGYIIPKGWCVLASFISVHMDEDIYDNPYQFDPWRWDRMNGSSAAGNISLCYTPFGGGQRLCPGLELSKLEMSIFLHHLVTRYKWTAEKDEIISFPTVKMKRRLPIRVVPVHI